MTKKPDWKMDDVLVAGMLCKADVGATRPDPMFPEEKGTVFVHVISGVSNFNERAHATPEEARKIAQALMRAADFAEGSAA